MKVTKGYKTGKSQPAWKCCRMIRICPPNKVGEIHDVFNMNTEEYESWMCIKVDKKNVMNNILQKIYK